MERYERYKDSGIEWIGEIPEGWEVVKFKYVTNLMTCGHAATPQYVIEDEGVVFLSAQNIKKEKIDLSDHRYISKNLHNSLSKNHWVERGDLLQVRVGGDSTIGQTAVFDLGFPISIYVSLSHIKLKINAVAGYIKQLCNSEKYRVYSSLIMKKGAGVANFNVSDQEKIKIPLPSVPEQTAIANYLDRKAAEIDELIAQKERLIELYEEEKTAIINQAVTKGIDPDVRLKDSGVDWLGEIPEGWEVKKLNWMTPILTCGLASTPSYSLEGIPFLSAQNIKDNQLVLDSFRYIPIELHDKLTKIRKPEKGDLLVTRVGAGIGDACIVDVDFEFSVYVSLTHIRVNKNMLNNKFLMYFFSTDYFQLLNKVETYQGGGVGNLNVENMKNYRIPIPKLADQTAIINHIETETARINAKIAKTKKIIELQKEYRTALISEVVTGKIKVTEETTL